MSCALVISTPVSIVSALAGAAQAGRARQGRHPPRAAGRRSRGRLRQDRHRHDRPSDARRGSPDRRPQRRRAARRWRRRSNRNPSIRLPPRSWPRAQPRGVAPRIRRTTCGRCPGSASKGACGDADDRVRHAAAVRRARRDDAGDRRRWRRTSSSRGMSPVVVARNGTPIGVLGVTDRPKADAAQVVADLRAQGVSRVAMLTGDHDAAAQATGSQLGVDDVRSAQLPAGQGDGHRAAARSARRRSPWSATASTTRRRWPRPTSAS